MLIVAYLCTAIILISYALLGRYGVRQFDVVNAATALPIIIADIELEAYYAALLSLVFAIVALVRLVCRSY